MKPGYKILIVVLIVSAFFYYKNKKAEEEAYYAGKVESILTDIRREDYFALHEKFLPKVAKNISIESIQNYIKRISLGSSYKFQNLNHKENNGTTTITGEVVSKKYRLPLTMTFKDINGTLYLLQQKIGDIKLQQSKNPFPLPVAKSVK